MESRNPNVTMHDDAFTTGGTTCANCGGQALTCPFCGWISCLEADNCGIMWTEPVAHFTIEITPDPPNVAISPTTVEARIWIEENVAYPGWYVAHPGPSGDRLICAERHIVSIVEEMVRDGLVGLYAGEDPELVKLHRIA